MTVIQVENSSPFAARIFVDGSLIIFQPYNPDGGVAWVSEAESRAWAESIAQENVARSSWPEIAE